MIGPRLGERRSQARYSCPRSAEAGKQQDKRHTRSTRGPISPACCPESPIECDVCFVVSSDCLRCTHDFVVVASSRTPASIRLRAPAGSVWLSDSAGSAWLERSSCASRPVQSGPERSGCIDAVASTPTEQLGQQSALVASPRLLRVHPESVVAGRQVGTAPPTWRQAREFARPTGESSILRHVSSPCSAGAGLRCAQQRFAHTWSQLRPAHP